MLAASLLALLAGILPAAATSGAPCAIQRAAAAGERVWILCDRDLLFVTADDGATWEAKRLPSGARFRAIAFLDSHRGFIAGDGGTLLATGDGGAQWRPAPATARENLTAIHFVGESGWVVGWGGTILHSADGGRTWNPQPSGITQGLESVFFSDSEHGWAVGWVGTILRTADGGRTWERVQTPSAMWSLSSVYFPDPRNGWIVGFNGQILRSRDGGATWEPQASPLRAWLTSVLFDKSGRGWIAAQNDLLVSEDGGESWKPAGAGAPVFFRQLLWANESIWAIGEFGVLQQAGGGLDLRAVAGLRQGGS